MLEIASKIHSASGGVRASQALDDEGGGFAIEARASGAMASKKGHTSGEQDVDCCKSGGRKNLVELGRVAEY